MRHQRPFTTGRRFGRSPHAPRLLLLVPLAACFAAACFATACFSTTEGRDNTAGAAAADTEIEVAADQDTNQDTDQSAGQDVDQTPHETHAEEAEAMKHLLRIEPGDTVADVGAGDGDWTEDLAGFVGEAGTVWATEVDEDLVDDLEDLAEDLPQIRPVLGDQDTIGLQDGCCDAILLRLVYHHFTDPAPMRADLRRALKPGARLLVVDITPQTSWRELDDVPDRGGHGIPTEQLIEEMESDGFLAIETLEAWGDEEDEFAVVFEVRPHP